MKKHFVGACMGPALPLRIATSNECKCHGHFKEHCFTTSACLVIIRGFESVYTSVYKYLKI